MPQVAHFASAGAKQLYAVMMNHQLRRCRVTGTFCILQLFENSPWSISTDFLRRRRPSLQVIYSGKQQAWSWCNTGQQHRVRCHCVGNCQQSVPLIFPQMWLTENWSWRSVIITGFSIFSTKISSSGALLPYSSSMIQFQLLCSS